MIGPTGLLPDVERILVLRANAIGDYLLAEPALRALRLAYPDARITLIGAPWQPGFLTERPGPVDEVRVLPRVPGLAGQLPGAPPTERLPEFLAEIRSLAADVAIQLHGGGAVANPLTKSLGARLTVGARAPGAEDLDRSIAYRYYQPEVARYLEVVGLIGARPHGCHPRLELIQADHREAGAVLPAPCPPPGGPLVALHPGVSDPRRRWPVANFAAVADALHAAGARLVLTGAPGDAELTAALVAAISTVTGSKTRSAVLDLTGRTSLGGLAAVYRRCALVIGVDTGPLHLARAVGTQTVTVFWCGNALNAGPAERGPHRTLLSWTMSCPECGAPAHGDLYPQRGLGPGCGHDRSWVAEVPAGEVIAEALDLLGPDLKPTHSLDPEEQPK